MEFLDNNSKRSRTIRLFTGYILVAIGIGLMSLILVYVAQGFSYDRKSGVIQNGLVIIDSQPVSGNIFIDSKQKGKTKTQFTLKEGTYNFKITQEKYRDWQKIVPITGGSVNYLLYPRLFPINIETSSVQTFNQIPNFMSQSPDRRWVISQLASSPSDLIVIDLQKPDQKPTILSIPQNIMSLKDGTNDDYLVSEWSDDNKHFILSGIKEGVVSNYILVNREDATQSVNLTTKLGLKPAQNLSLYDKKFDKYLIHDIDSKELKKTDLKNGNVSSLVANGVISYKSYGDNLVMYVTYTDAQASDARIIILNNSDSYYLQNIPRNSANKYTLDIAQFQDDWYYVVSNPSTSRINIYNNPLSQLKPNNTTPLNQKQSLLFENLQASYFSGNARFISFQSGKQFLVVDNELHKIYRFVSPLDINEAQVAKWMDGHRLCVSVNNKALVFEFDGTNLQTLTTSLSRFVPIFDRDYKNIFTVSSPQLNKAFLQKGSLIAK